MMLCPPLYHRPKGAFCRNAFHSSSPTGSRDSRLRMTYLPSASRVCTTVWQKCIRLLYALRRRLLPNNPVTDRECLLSVQGGLPSCRQRGECGPHLSSLSLDAARCNLLLQVRLSWRWRKEEPTTKTLGEMLPVLRRSALLHKDAPRCRRPLRPCLALTAPCT